MVELRTKITETGVLYVPKELREAFSREMRIISNATAAVFFSADTKYADVLESLKIIMLDIRHRQAMQKEKGQ
jgi:bifunctional DNA-binding transcriptional regulator/antitoxin component of YhaV-PrlF toxin-antitoxin module